MPAVCKPFSPPHARVPRYPLIERLRSEQLRLLFRYGVAAAIATLWDAVLFGQLYQVVFASFVWAKAMSYSTGVVLHFLLAKWFVFTGQRQTGGRTQFLRFVLVALVVLAANVLVIKTLLDALAGADTGPISPRLVNTLVSGLAAVLVGFVSFTLNRLYAFR